MTYEGMGCYCWDINFRSNIFEWMHTTYEFAIDTLHNINSTDTTGYRTNIATDSTTNS